MTATQKVFNGETVIEKIKMEVCGVGDGAIVTVTFVDDKDTALVAESVVIPDWGFDIGRASDEGGKLVAAMKERLLGTVRE